MRSRRNTKRNCNQKFKYRCNCCNEEGRTDSIRVENFRDNGTLADKASAKVELTNIFYPIIAL